MAHWTYQEELDRSRLMQGDLLERTPDLDKLLEEYFCYQAHNRNQHFLVATQSCDLEQGKAGLVTISPVRHISTFLAENTAPSSDAFRVAHDRYLSTGSYARTRDLLRRLVNNNLSGFFFLRGDRSYGLNADSVAYLRQKLALMPKHLQVLLEAKRGQLSSEFQAKIGWLLGDLYSRVGTQDWTAPMSRKKSMDTLLDLFMKQFKQVDHQVLVRVEKKVSAFVGPLQSEQVDAWIQEEVNSIPSRDELVRDAIAQVWPTGVGQEERDGFTRRLIRSRKFKEALK